VLQFSGMVESKQLVENALAIFRQWNWGFIDPDGYVTYSSVELQHALNRLAFCGCEDPVKAILVLLCDGRLTAVGDYQWLYFRHHKRFAFSGTTDNIDKEKWQRLSKLLGEVKWGGEEDDWEQVKIDLDQLEMKDQKTAEWQPEYNRCSFASYTPSTESYLESYYEEWFLATGIEILLSPNELSGLRQANTDPVANEEVSDNVSQALTPLSEADLKKWWNSKSKVRDLLSKDELLALIRSKYPDNHISRERIRDLAGARKRGPKGLSG